jgi:oligopeptide transport system ATP-binding protein
MVCATRSTSRKRDVDPTLSVDELNVRFAHRTGTLEAVAGASLRIEPKECIGVVGESGSGKTQLFLAAMGLLPGHAKVSGSIRFSGNEVLGAKAAVLNRVRGSKLTMIFQDPMTSLTPHLRVGTQLSEVLVCHAGLSWSEARAAAGRMLEQVRIPDVRRRLQQYPYELSGGMRQRVMLAMSLLCKPELLIADEPTTALDVTVQAQIMELLRAARGETGMALVLISHDLGVIAGLADRILVMYAGRIVENAAVTELLRRPRHPYTAELLKCVPSLSGPLLARMPTLAGQPPQPGEALQACPFAPRCPRAADRCRVERPALAGAANASVACHFPLS